MGKYMKKSKITSDVAVMEVSQSSLGVKTRAKTLALQRLQKSNSPEPSCYLQLRSRRLEKPLVVVETHKPPNPKMGCPQNPNPSHNRDGSVGSFSFSCSKGVDHGGGDDGFCGKCVEVGDNGDLGIEVSFGENNLEFDGRERSTRESTPCSLIRGSDTIGTPGSTTRPACSTATNRRVQSALQRNIPTTCEMEEFFALAEKQQQRLFMEKYNFDVMKDLPLPGRYEWVRVNP